jgi:hypothetical protein
MLACHLQMDADPVPDPAYHFDADPDADTDPNFYLMRMRIQVIKMMRIHADPDPQHCWLETLPLGRGSWVRVAGWAPCPTAAHAWEGTPRKPRTRSGSEIKYTIKRLKRGIIVVFSFYERYSTLFHLPQIPLSRRMLGSNPGQLRLRDWLSDALTTRLDLIHTRIDLIHQMITAEDLDSGINLKSFGSWVYYDQ